MTQKLLSFGDDYDVMTAAGVPAFRVDGKVLRVRDILHVQDLQTGDTYRISEKIARVTDTMTIQQNGHVAATVKKAIVSPVRDRFWVIRPGAENLRVQGNVLAHEYRFERAGETVAEVSKQWFRVRDSYGIEVAPGMDAGLVVTCTVALDMMVNPAR